MEKLLSPVAEDGLSERRTLTIQFSKLAELLLKHGYCELNGLGTLTLTEDDNLEFEIERNMREVIQLERQIQAAGANMKEVQRDNPELLGSGVR